MRTSDRVTEPTLGFQQVQELLAAMHGVVPDRRKQMLFRFQQFRRLGFPAGVQTGRGKPAKYRVAQLIPLLVAFEMLDAGLSPERIVQLIVETGTMLSAFSRSAAAGERSNEVLAIVRPEALADLRRPWGDSHDSSQRVYFSPVSRVGETLANLHLGRRALVINLSEVMRDLEHFLINQCDAEPGDLHAAVVAWHNLESASAVSGDVSSK